MKRGRRPEALFVGYGNPLRGDDAVGRYVAGKLGGMVIHQLVPELAERLAAQELVVFIDARRDLEPGAVEIMPIDETAVMTHSCSAGYLLKLTRQVYGRAPRGLMVGIGAESFEFGAPLSEPVRRAAQRALWQLRCLQHAPQVTGRAT